MPTTPATPAPPEGGSNDDLGGSYHLAVLDSLLMSIVSDEIYDASHSRSSKRNEKVEARMVGRGRKRDGIERKRKREKKRKNGGEEEGQVGRGERKIRNAAKSASLPFPSSSRRSAGS